MARQGNHSTPLHGPWVRRASGPRFPFEFQDCPPVVLLRQNAARACKFFGQVHEPRMTVEPLIGLHHAVRPSLHAPRGCGVRQP